MVTAAASRPTVPSLAVRSPERGEQLDSESMDRAIRSAASPQENPFWPLQKLQDIKAEVKSGYKCYEDAFVQKVKDGIMIVRDHSSEAFGITIVSSLLLMRGPRKILWRQTLGRLQSEEAKLAKIDTGLKVVGGSVDKLKKDSKNMLLRASFGEEELQRGRTKIRDAGKEIRRLIKSVYKIESRATDVMDELRVIPGRNALKLRAEVASMMSDLKQQRYELNKKILRISELGVRV
ncbi:hypothetical protein HPP92_014370 [Vanilla planifolia]|uniref:Uncharacterized protein n=1 Tax=Vanilla planifolia TaxID=51239 RepID=A0A835QRR9_VANPL|nr:hypothetical protein HPP92_014370 [Vanilla planifolia]